MKKIKGILLIVVLNLFQYISLAQDQHLIDSLQAQLKQLEGERTELRNGALSLKDSTAAKILNELSGIFIDNNLDKALEYAEQCLALSEQIGWKKGIGSAYLMMGYHDLNQGDNLSALSFFKKALKLYSEAGWKKDISYSYNALGRTYFELDNYPDALKNYLAALKIREELRIKPEIAGSLNNVGNVHFVLRDMDQALKYYSAALKINRETGNKAWEAINLSNIGLIYEDQKKYTESMQNLLAALKMFEETGDNKNIALSYSDIGHLYFSQKNVDEALTHEHASLKINEEMGFKDGIAQSFTRLGSYYFSQKKYKEAYEYLNKGLSVSKETGSLFSLAHIHASLAALDSSQGRFAQALEHYKLHIATRDSLSNRENTKKITQQQMQYEFDKKESLAKAEQEKKDAVALEEIEKQKLVRNGFIGGFAVVLLFAGVFLRQRNKIKQGNIELKIAKERAEHSERLEQQFLANMSHEIRTPMNAVMGMTNLVLDTPLNPKQKFYLDIIKKSADNLLYIINDILDISKIEAGKLDIEKIDFSIETVSKQVVQTLQHKADEKGLELVLNVDPALPPVVLGDPVRLNQVLMNLAGNAIKFTEKGSVAIEVKKNQAGVTFSIIDTGIGIPKDKLQTVFESFSQANSSDTRKYGGTGLGLSISRQLVELMGGKIGIESVEGSGTAFYFTLNFETGSEAGLKQRLANEESVDGSILDALSILVVDDNEYNRIVAKDTLESKSKAKVTAVDGAKEAIKLLQQTPFDLVLMDVQMPEMNGFEATQYIRTKLDAPLKNIPIVALTASVLRADLDKCTAAGMNSYIPKPFKTSQLIAGIAQVLNIEIRTNLEVDDLTSPSAKKEIGANNTKTLNITSPNYLHKFCEGDETKMKKYIGLYTSAAPSLITNINEALKKNNLEDLANQIHSFKTKWIMMGMTETKKLAMEIENQCREGIGDEKLSSNILKLVAQVKDSIKELS